MLVFLAVGTSWSCARNDEGGGTPSPTTTPGTMTPFTVPARNTEPAAAGTPPRGAATPEDAIREVLDAWREGDSRRAEQYLGEDPEFGREHILPLQAGHQVLLVTGSCQSQRQPDRVYCRIAQPDDSAISGDAIVVGTPSSGYLITRIYLVIYD